MVVCPSARTTLPSRFTRLLRIAVSESEYLFDDFHYCLNSAIGLYVCKLHIWHSVYVYLLLGIVLPAHLIICWCGWELNDLIEVTLKCLMKLIYIVYKKCINLISTGKCFSLCKLIYRTLKSNVNEIILLFLFFQYTKS